MHLNSKGFVGCPASAPGGGVLCKQTLYLVATQILFSFYSLCTDQMVTEKPDILMDR